jgi:hypothetical protein
MLANWHKREDCSKYRYANKEFGEIDAIGNLNSCGGWINPDKSAHDRNENIEAPDEAKESRSKLNRCPSAGY